MGVCLLELSANNDGMKTEASKLMNRVPSLRQKIAGKSIPLEVRSQFLFLKKKKSYIFSRNSWPERHANSRCKAIGLRFLAWRWPMFSMESLKRHDRL